MFSFRLFFCLSVLLTGLWISQAAEAVVIETVVVGNPGNAPGPLIFGDGPFGAVAETFGIAKYEVTNAQYVEFLNAVAATDTHGLYDAEMTSNLRGGIERSGVSGSFTYSPKTNFANKPVNYTSFWDAARFSNWLHNGQPTGAQGSGTTEDGAYALNGVTNPANESVNRDPSAKWFIPTKDQSYKAAFHQPASQGGDSDDYWLYATGTNTQPIEATANATGDISNPGPNVVNYGSGAFWNFLNGHVTTVGSAGPLSNSFYGTADQSGNVWELTESIFSPEVRSLNGGSYFMNARVASSEDHTTNRPESGSRTIGFRMAIPWAAAFVEAGSGSTGKTFGGAASTGGIDFAFNGNVSSAGQFTGEYVTADPADLDDLLPPGAESLINFSLASDPVQFWEIDFAGTFSGDATLTFSYDDSNLLGPEDELFLYHFADGSWTEVTDGFLLDTVANTITIDTDGFSPFLLGSQSSNSTAAIPEPSTLTLAALGFLALIRRRRRR